jgi:hypothetical protein
MMAPQVHGHDPLVLVDIDVTEPGAAADAGDVEDRVHLAERIHRGGEHRFDVGLLRHVCVERHERVAELVGRLLLAAADVGAEDPGPLSNEHPGRCSGHARSRAGDDRDLAVQFSHGDVVARS